MRGPRKTHMGKPCDVCGGTGFGELIVGCFQCKTARRHVYCMQVLLEYVPEIWVCEICSADPVTPKSTGEELFNEALELNTSEIVHLDMSQSVGSQRLIKESCSSGHRKNQTSSKVKFIPIEEAVKIYSGAQKAELPSRTELHSSYVWKKEERSSTTQAQASTESKHKATHIKYKDRDICKKESVETPCIDLPGGNLPLDANPKKSLIEGCNRLNILPVPEKNLPSDPVLDATWCGSLVILDSTVSCAQVYDGFRAHIPWQVRRKALAHSKLMPSVLQCTLLPCRNVRAEIFQHQSPTITDMALFFSPGNFNRSRQQYFRLLALLEMRDVALKSLINGVNLLIFSSKRLSLDVHGLKIESFLWGVYCSKSACW